MNSLTAFLLLLFVLDYKFNQYTCRADIYTKARIAKENEFPFVASIGLLRYGDVPYVLVHICSGVLVTRKHVITTAHCTTEVKDKKNVIVKLGDVDWFLAKRYYIKYWITYDEWARDNYIMTERFEHDISIIKLAGKVNCEIQPAVIAKPNYNDFYGKQAEVVTWGPGKNDQRNRFMIAANLRVISDNQCQKTLNETPPFRIEHIMDKTYLCTNLNFSIILENTDSGSPLLINKREVIAINDPTYLYRRNIWFPVSLNFHIKLDYYETFIQNVTQTRSPKWWHRRLL